MKRLRVWVLFLLCVSVAGAADLYSSGGKMWNTSLLNWGTISGGPYDAASWNNSPPDSAVFEGTPGTVSLGAAIRVDDIRFTADSSGYTISAGTLNFVAGGSITQAVRNVKHTITSAITGAPDVGVINGTGYNGLTFAPSAGTVALGVCTVPYDDPVGGDKAGIHFGGSTSGNSVSQVRYDGGDRYGAIYVEGSGDWTFGNVKIGTVYITGDLIANGTIDTDYGGMQLQNGGTLHYNNAGAILDNFRIYGGGSMDNSSGAAVATSTHNPPQTWYGDWTFIGSNGANSDLNLGTGTVTLSGGDRQVTVQNAATTLTIDGVVGDSTSVFGLTKAGAGTLRLTADNTYNGNTTVEAGTLSISEPYLDDSASVSVTNGATLYLDFSGTDVVTAVVLNGVVAAPGEWGGPASGADNTTNLLSGTGILYHSGGLAPEGMWYWDGPNTGGAGDAASDGGAGTWSTSVTNWDHGLVAREAWPNTTNDTAIFRTLAGTVALGSDITLGEILIDGVETYYIGSDPETQTLNFGGAASIVVDKVSASIRAGIAGSPAVHHYGGSRENLYLDPDSVSMTLGTITVGEDTSSNPRLYLRGSTTGNTAVAVQKAWTYSFLHKEDSGTWTIGDIDIGQINLSAGKLVINGTSVTPWSSFNFTAGTLAGTGVVSDAITVPAGGVLAPGASTGTLTVSNNNCTINGTLQIMIDRRKSPMVGTLVVDGELDISGAALAGTVLEKPPVSPLVIGRYKTLIGSEFATVTGLDGRWVIDYKAEGGTAIVVFPPSQGSVLIVR